jgi:choline-sulfatase
VTARPNILWLMGDEFRTDSLSCYGTPFPQVVTPNIDRIANAGVRFTNTFCNSPICVPSRTSQMTANPPERTGVYGNEGAWTSYRYGGEPLTFPEHFARHGYRTNNIGKTHLPKALKPWQVDDHVGADMATFFKDVDPETKKRNAIVTPGLKAPIGGTFPGPVEFPGNKLTRRAVKWLREEASAETPFLARISYLQPHSPVMPPAPYDRRYADLPWPSTLDTADPGCNFARRFAEVVQASALSPDQIVRVHSDYYGLVAWLDAQVGVILDALEAAGLSENTIVVLEADHGVSLGERGRLQKHTFFPEVHRVPMIVSWPGRLAPGQVRADLSELMDLARTLCGLAGIPAVPSFGGRDLFRDPAPKIVFSTIGYGGAESYALPVQVSGRWFDGGGWPRRVCARTARYRLDITTRCDGKPVPPDEEDEYLADLAIDPLEEVNRAADPGYAAVRADLRDAILRHVCDALEPSYIPQFSDAERGFKEVG